MAIGDASWKKRCADAGLANCSQVLTSIVGTPGGGAGLDVVWYFGINPDGTSNPPAPQGITHIASPYPYCTAPWYQSNVVGTIYCRQDRYILEAGSSGNGAGPGSGSGSGPGSGPGSDPGAGPGPDNQPPGAGPEPSGEDNSCGAFPGTSFGNPVEASLGVKQQSELLYSDPRRLLSFYLQYEQNPLLQGFALLPVFTHNFDVRLILPSSVVSVPESSYYGVVRRYKKTALFNGADQSPVVADGSSIFTKVTTANGIQWRFVDLNESAIYVFDATGRLQSKTFASGKSISFNYSASAEPGYAFAGLLKSVTDQYGRALVLSYDASGRLSQFKDPLGQTYAFGYNGSSSNCANCGLLTSVTFPNGSQRIYHFNEPTFNLSPDSSMLTGVTNELGVRESTFKYNVSGQVVSTERANGVYKYQFTYAGGNASTSIQTPNGGVYTQQYVSDNGSVWVSSVSQPAGSGCAAASRYLSRDANYNVSSSTNFVGVNTSYSYDLARNLETQRIEAVGTNVQRTISTQWHPDWNLKQRVAAPKLLMTNVYNGQPDPTNGNATLSCIPSTTPLLPNGKPLAVLCKTALQATSDETGLQGFSAVVQGLPRTWLYTYDSDGQILTLNGPRSDITDVTTYTYYPNADTATPKKWNRGDLKSVINAANHVTNFDQYDLNGRLLKVTAATGTIINNTYYPRGWLATSSATASGVTLTTTYDYWLTGNIKRRTYASGNYLEYSYDPAQRLSMITDSQNGSIVFTRDAKGNAVSEVWKDLGGTVRRQEVREFDALGRVQKETGGSR